MWASRTKPSKTALDPLLKPNEILKDYNLLRRMVGTDAHAQPAVSDIRMAAVRSHCHDATQSIEGNLVAKLTVHEHAQGSSTISLSAFTCCSRGRGYEVISSDFGVNPFILT